MSLHLQAVDSILFQQDKFHLRSSGSCWLWDLRTFTGHGRLPHNRPTKAIQPEAAPRWEKACEDAKSFCVNQKCDPSCREGSCGHTGSPQAPCQLNHPPLQGDLLKSSMQTSMAPGWAGGPLLFPVPVPPTGAQSEPVPTRQLQGLSTDPSSQPSSLAAGEAACSSSVIDNLAGTLKQ